MRTHAGAIASSFLWCELMQPIDLMAALSDERGFTSVEAAALLDTSPPMQFSICYGARTDCRAECEVSGWVCVGLSQLCPTCCTMRPECGTCMARTLSNVRVQILLVLDDGTQPLPLYVGRQSFSWDRDALTSWDSGPLHPDNGAWHSISASFHGGSHCPSPLLCRRDASSILIGPACCSATLPLLCAGYPAGVRRALVRCYVVPCSC